MERRRPLAGRKLARQLAAAKCRFGSERPDDGKEIGRLQGGPAHKRPANLSRGQDLGGIFFILCLAIVVVTGRAQHTGGLVDKANVGKIDAGLLKREAPPPAQPAQSPDNGLQAPLPNIGGSPNPAPAAPFGSPTTLSPVAPPAK